jgi:GAF domain-containing protein
VSGASVAKALAWLTAALVVADVAVSAQAVRLTSETAVAVHGFPFIDGAVLGSAVLGALIVSRYERHPIGWLLSVVGAIGAVSLVTEAYAFWVQETDGPGPALLGGIAAWVSTLFGGQVIIGGLALMFLLAPDGHLLSRRWRYAAWVTAAGMLLCVAAVLSTPPADYRLTTSEEEIGLVRRLALTVGFLAIIGGLVAAVVSVLVRLRRSHGEQRLQLRLVALAAALPTFGVLCLLVVQALNGDQQTWAAALPLFISYFLLPILFAVAALRHRLYELDVIVNRTVVVVAGVAFAAVGYSALVVASGRLLEGTGGGFWLSLLGTAVVALAFQPLRRRVVRLANRLAYGQRAQPYEALADFSRRLAAAPPPGALLPAVAESAGRAVSASGAVALLDVPGDQPLRGSWGEPEPADHVFPVRLEDRVLGTIGVALPRGRALDDADRALLEAVAEQAATAFRNTALASELAAHVDDLARTTRELAESRLRLVEADDAARRGLESAIARDVLPLIADLPTRIGRLRSAVTGGDVPMSVEPLVADTNAALESLRDLSRGVFPSPLARAGLEPALRSMLARAERRPSLTLDGVIGHRFPARVEAALYFCCVEAARPGGHVEAIRLELDGRVVRLALDGVDPGALDLRAITDRIGAAGGTVTADLSTLLVSVPVPVSAGPVSAGPVSAQPAEAAASGLPRR